MDARYSKIDVSALYASRNKKAKKFILFALLFSAALVLAAACVYLVFAALTHHHHNKCQAAAPWNHANPTQDHEHNDGLQAIQDACNGTLYQQLCIDSLSTYPGGRSAMPRQLVTISMKVALEIVNQTYGIASNLTREQGSSMEGAALKDCLELLDDARGQITDSISRLSQLDSQSFDSGIKDVQTWLSASLTDQTTCSDGFDGQNGPITHKILKAGDSVSHLLSNSLALVSTLSHLGSNVSSWPSSKTAALRIPAASPTAAASPTCS